jgi:hypothetical protein
MTRFGICPVFLLQNSGGVSTKESTSPKTMKLLSLETILGLCKTITTSQYTLVLANVVSRQLMQVEGIQIK